MSEEPLSLTRRELEIMQIALWYHDCIARHVEEASRHECDYLGGDYTRECRAIYLKIAKALDETPKDATT